MFPLPSGLRPGNGDDLASGTRSTRSRSNLSFVRRRTTFELPPEDSVAFLDIPRLKRRGTLESFLAGASDLEPFPAKYYHEPEGINGTHDAIIEELESSLRAYVRTIERVHRLVLMMPAQRRA
jgi:hypothetical protein